MLVEVDITAGSTYRNTVTTSSFRIITEAPSPQTASGIVAQEMTAAGYKPVGDVRTGESGTGWIAFPVSPPNAKTLTFRYSRLAANVLNASGKSITAKDFDVPLVK